jgi:hypothetical protein
MGAMKGPARVIPFPASRRAAPPPAADTPPALVEVARCRDQAEAVVVRSLLESAGIPAVARGRVVQSVHPFSVGEQAEVAILVPPPDAPHARAVLARRRGPRQQRSPRKP